MSPSRRPGTPRLLRALNDRAALELLLTQGPLTRAQLGELTGLSKVTASQLVERLERRGLVEHVGSQVGGRGPNALLYALVPHAAYVVGVDITYDRLLVAAADLTGRIVARATAPIREDSDPARVVRDATAELLGDVPASRLRRAVLGTPGLVHPATGDLSLVVAPPRRHREFLDAIRGALEVPVVFENDVMLAAVAEAREGAARGVGDFILFWVDQGVGMASMINGRLHRGATGAAGEIAYLPIGGISSTHVAERHDHGSIPFRRLVGSGAVAGLTEVEELANRLAVGVAAAGVVLDPELVVLAGAVARTGGQGLARRVEREVHRLAPVIKPRVVLAEVESEAVLRGALLTAVDEAREELFES